MNQAFVENLNFSAIGQSENHLLPVQLRESLRIISGFFQQHSNNKLCLVFPSKDFSAQWLAIPTVLSLIESDFEQFKNEITTTINQYKKGDKVILNNEAVVKWVGASLAGFTFKHKEFCGVDEITINIKKISKIQPAPLNRPMLATYKRVIDAVSKVNDEPLDKLLGINTEGNKIFQKNSICLISRFISYENATSDICLNDLSINEYFDKGKIDDAGELDVKSPLLISNNLTNLALYIALSDNVSRIVIDGFAAIRDRSIDFLDIDAKRIPTILITDLSEVEDFPTIGDYGFDFYNFTKDNILQTGINTMSPFREFETKLQKYASYSVTKEICENEQIEKISKYIHSITNDESEKELTTLKILLIQLTNCVSRIAQPLTQMEAGVYKDMLKKIDLFLSENRFYLGSSVSLIIEAISLLNSVIEKFAHTATEKSIRLKELIIDNRYTHIICVTEDEASRLSSYLHSFQASYKPLVITMADVTTKLQQNNPGKAILIGWPKSNNVNRLLSSFIFSELTVLFYPFELRYFESLQNRNYRFSQSIQSTITSNGTRVDSQPGSKSSFNQLYKCESHTDIPLDFDITNFELKLDNDHYSKYIVKGSQVDSIKAKRVEFKNNKFIYLTDTRNLLVLENYNSSSKRSLHIQKSRIESLRQGDIIAFISTERELLNRIVERQTTASILSDTAKWIDLWKRSLKNHYKSLNNDFNRLTRDLKEIGCNRDPVTIRSWLFDELRIGPRKDEDLISIAILADNTELYENIKQVRRAIKQMTSWRMKASDFVIDQLKSKIKTIHSKVDVNCIVNFEDLGEIEILEITEIKNTQDNVDIRNANRLLEKSPF
jgi:hypothetical protein